MQPAEFGKRSFDGTPAVGFNRDIGDDGDRGVRAMAVLDFRRNGLRRCCLDIEYRDARAAIRQAEGHGPSETAAPARQQHNFSLEIGGGHDGYRGMSLPMRVEGCPWAA